MNTFIAQSPTVPPPPAPPTGLTEWGVLGAVLLYAVKEIVAFLKQKDTSESTLTNSLVTDIRETNKELREYLQHGDRAADKIIKALGDMEPRLASHSSQLLLDQRERLAKLTSQVEALHTRLDKQGVADSHSRKVI